MTSLSVSGFVLGCALVSLSFTRAAQADWVPTNVGNGADAEVRDHQPDTNFGSST